MLFLMLGYSLGKFNARQRRTIMSTNYPQNARDTPSQNRLLNENEAAEILNVSVKTLQYWRVAGGGPVFVKMRRLVRYEMEALLQFVEERRQNNTCHNI